MLPTFLLMNLLSLAGDVALQQLVHLEQAVSGELCRRRVLREEQEHKRKEPKEKVSRTPALLGSCPRCFPDSLPALRSFTLSSVSFRSSASLLFVELMEALPPCSSYPENN